MGGTWVLGRFDLAPVRNAKGTKKMNERMTKWGEPVTEGCVWKWHVKSQRWGNST